MNSDALAKPDAPGSESELSELLSLIGRRVSCRSYRADPIPEELLRKILEAARLAPSACNQQPWRFVVVRDRETRRRIVEEGLLPGLRMAWALEAPAHIVLGMHVSFLTHRLGASVSGVDYPWVDVGIAGEHLVLAATAAGLGTCWIGWIRSGALADIVGWPDPVRPVAVITVGYPASAPENSALPCARRKPADEIVRWLEAARD